jgi:SAM-dependent methyltransferase
MRSLYSLLQRLARPLRRAVLQPKPNEPSGALLESARSIAFLVNTASDADGEAWIEAAKGRGAQIDMLPLFKPYRREDERTMSFLLPPPRRNYDCVVVHRSVAMFEHSWTYALLDRLNGFLGDSGVIFVPRRAHPTRHVSDARLEEMFGQKPVHATKRFLAFGKTQAGLKRPAGADYSALDAYFPVRDALLHGRFDPALASTIRALGASRAEPHSAYRADGFLTQLKSQCYRTCSASAKAPLVEYLAAQYFPGRSDLRVVDLGAGTGLNSMELLLNPSGVAHVTLVEPNWPYHWDIAQMYEQLGERVRGKVALAGEGVEAYRGTPVEIGMVCGVFSILPHELREPFMQGAWANVAPGGILAVLENMRDSDPVRGGKFNATRFTPPEIDAMLGRFGPIRYFKSTAMEEAAPADVGMRAVFRVVQKPLG